MADVELKDIHNKVKGSVHLPDEVFGLSARKDILHTSVLNFLANQRQGTHATKTKGLVSGGGKKPWKQKHTGRARAGSIRSPLWRGGGTTFGPQPRDYSYTLPKNFKRRALREALSSKVSDGAVTIVEGISIEKPSTKEMIRILESLGLAGSSILIVLDQKGEAVFLSARNIPRVTVVRYTDLNPYVILTHDKLLMTKDALGLLAEGCAA